MEKMSAEKAREKGIKGIQKEYHSYCCKVNQYNSSVKEKEREKVLSFGEWIKRKGGSE